MVGKKRKIIGVELYSFVESVSLLIKKEYYVRTRLCNAFGAVVFRSIGETEGKERNRCF